MSAGSGEPLSIGGFRGSPVGGFGGTGIGGFAGSPVGGFGGSFGSHLSGLSGGGFHNDPLANNIGRFTSPSALVGQHTAAAGAS
jgi:outer membrane lipoprotein SlyB